MRRAIGRCPSHYWKFLTRERAGHRARLSAAADRLHAGVVPNPDLLTIVAEILDMEVVEGERSAVQKHKLIEVARRCRWGPSIEISTGESIRHGHPSTVHLRGRVGRWLQRALLRCSIGPGTRMVS